VAETASSWIATRCGAEIVLGVSESAEAEAWKLDPGPFSWRALGHCRRARPIGCHFMSEQRLATPHVKKEGLASLSGGRQSEVNKAAFALARQPTDK
jgi:hypothetical protein